MPSGEVRGWHTALQEYFADKAASYNERGDEPYWRFSDDLLWRHVAEAVAGLGTGPFKFLDAGAGTGRWSLRLLEAYAASTGVLVDRSPDMLRVAEADLRRTVEADRWLIQRSDLDHELPAACGPADLIICFHNVIGFVADADSLAARLARLLSDRGTLLLMLPNALHAIYFSLMRGEMREVARVRDAGEVRFSSGPAMRVFTGEDMAGHLRAVGFDVKCRGLPVTVYPSPSESYARAKASVASLLSDPAARNELLDLEWSLSRQEALSTRGNNLLLVVRRGGVG